MALRPDPADLLARTPLFGALDEPSRKAVALELRDAAFEPGQIIFSRGQAGSELHIVTKGRVRLSVLTADGRELSFAHVEAPSIFGELAVFDGRPRSADATAVNKVETLMLSKTAFLRLLGTRPAVGEAAVRFLATYYATPMNSSKPSLCIRSKRGSHGSSSPPCARKIRPAKPRRSPFPFRFRKVNLLFLSGRAAQRSTRLWGYSNPRAR